MLERNTRLFEFATDGQSVDDTESARKAIADFFCERPAELDIRHVWDRAGRRFFRVNFWSMEATTGGPTIRRSAFVATDISNGSIQVHEVN